MISKADASGTTQYIWDFENRLRQVIKPDGTSINYKYDALGRRSERYIGANSTKFTYDGDDVILDVNSDGSFVKYLNGLGIDNKIRQTVNGQAQYFVQDHLGSTNALTDTTGNVISSATYDSFGNIAGNLNTRYEYTGREKDAETGFYFYRNRWYSSELGRFISEDPIGFKGGVNQFGYVDGNPIKFSDPLGLQTNPEDLGLGWTARVDAFNSGEGFEIHVYDPQGNEAGIVSGRNGWIAKHGHSPSPPYNIPEDVLNKLNGLNVEELRSRGLIPPKGIAKMEINGEEVSGNIRGAKYLHSGRVLYGMGITIGILGLFDGLLSDYETYKRSKESGCSFDEQFKRDHQNSPILIGPFGVIPNCNYYGSDRLSICRYYGGPDGV